MPALADRAEDSRPVRPLAADAAERGSTAAPVTEARGAGAVDAPVPGPTVNRPLRVLIGADTYPPDISGAAPVHRATGRRPRRARARGSCHRPVRRRPSIGWVVLNVVGVVVLNATVTDTLVAGVPANSLTGVQLYILMAGAAVVAAAVLATVLVRRRG